MKGNPRYALVRVDGTRYCPSRYEKINRDFVCAGLPYCYKCRYGDTKEQLVRKIAQALLIDQIERYRKAPNCDVNKTIVKHESRICLEKARKIVEFLGVE